MAKKKQEKRKFTEDIFNLGIFGEMLDILKADVNENKKTFDLEVTKHDEISKNILSLQKQQELQAQERQRKKDKYVSRQESNFKEIAEINKKLEKFELPDVQEIKKSIAEQDTNSAKADKKLQDIRHSVS